ncbi:hypothetical protein AB0O07_35610 [Streptomyces sp. NPDC093085]|uniref:hypothetical protein n=1 Tax=Streptomyces sp. NPDC093085 TaxID=3155068 RepID=UPI003423A93D
MNDVRHQGTRAPGGTAGATGATGATDGAADTAGAVAARLLDAGAVLPYGPGEGDGDGGGAAGGDVLTARAYGHPALDGRTVVRLVPEAIGAAEDLSLEYLGFGEGRAERVGRVRRQSLGFPAWALVNDPGNGHHALAVVKEMERLTRLVATKPGLAKEGFDEIGARLDRSVPHFLPTFYEQVARLFLGVESPQQASVFFGKARAAEQRHALAVDEARLREVFLEFAEAGALSGKALREHAKGLTDRLSPEEAYAEFLTVSRERCAAGLAPYAGMLEDLRRLARGAGLDAGAEERALLGEIIHLGPMNRAAGSFWKSALPALTRLAAEDRAVRERLLALLPTTGGEHPERFDASWLELLDECGAVELLLDGTVPAAAWLSGWAAHRRRGWRDAPRVPAELALVERLRDRLVADGTPVRLLGHGWRSRADLDLLDACLAWGVPVVGPDPGARHLDLQHWLSDPSEGRRDLAALAGDPRFTRILRAGVEEAADTHGATELLERIVALPALRSALVGWFDERAEELSRPLGLPGLDAQLGRLSHFTAPSVLATAPEAVARITAVSAAPALARTLRAGVLDELGWPALEEALPGLGGVGRDPSRHWAEDDCYRIGDAWPALLVRVGAEAVAVGPTGVVDRRTLVLPSPSGRGRDGMVIRYAGGQWLVVQGHGAERRGVWSGRPAEVFTPDGDLPEHWSSHRDASLELPDGGRCFGGRPIHPGDTSFALERRPVASDGISVWVLHEDQWWEYDPESARRGRVSVPGFFGSAPVDGDGVRLVERACQLLPVRPGQESSPFGTKDGLLGWWVVEDRKAGTVTACSVDGGRSPAVTLPRGASPGGLGAPYPLPPLRLPAGAVLHPRESRGYRSDVELYDADGLLLATVQEGAAGGAHAQGTPLVVPTVHWHALRPRDERGSAALRAVTDEDAAALLAAVGDGPAGEQDEERDEERARAAEAAVREVLPQVTHPGLVAGVAGLVVEAARHAGRLRVLAEQAARDSAVVRKVAVEHAFDEVLEEAFQGLGRSPYRYYGSADRSAGVLDQMRRLHEAVASGPVTDPSEGHAEPMDSPLGWASLCGAGMAALAVRAAAPTTEERHRAGLLEFLDAALSVTAGSLEGAGGADGDALLIDPRGRLRTVELVAPQKGRGRASAGQVRAEGARRLLVLGHQYADGDDAVWHAVEYDPAGAFGGWAGAAVRSSQVLGAPGDPVRAPSVRRMVELVRERGPLPYRPEWAVEFADRVGTTAVAAALFQLGSPGVGRYGETEVLGAEHLEPLGAKSAEVRVGRAALAVVGLAERCAYTALLLPADPAEMAGVWADGFPMGPAAEAWIAARGRRRVTPAWLVRQMVAELGGGVEVNDALNPGLLPALSGRTTQGMVEDELTAARPELLLTGRELRGLVDAVRWLAYRLPYGDPLRAVLPETVRAVRRRLADPGLLLHLEVSRDDSWNAVAPRLREAHGVGAEQGKGGTKPFELSPALVLVPDRYGNDESVWVRPSAVDGPDHPDLLLLAATAGHSPSLAALRTVLGEGFLELVSADGEPGAQQHPGRSVPALVGEVTGRTGLSEDAAALYLMLLALPDPTDRNQVAWTGWKPARIKRARAELAATDLVVEAKRARAGRSLFLPGGWQEASAPVLPSESWKAPLVDADIAGFVVAHRPVERLFETAWRRVVEGDAPGYEEFRSRTGRGRRGGTR